MAHFAKVAYLNETRKRRQFGTVMRVIVCEREFLDTFKDDSPGEWIKCSFNTRGGKYYRDDGTLGPDQSKALRGNYPGIGWLYDKKTDAFFPPRPFPSWRIDEANFTWTPPTPMPRDGKWYEWDEKTKAWVDAATIVDED